MSKRPQWIERMLWAAVGAFLAGLTMTLLAGLGRDKALPVSQERAALAASLPYEARQIRLSVETKSTYGATQRKWLVYSKDGKSVMAKVWTTNSRLKFVKFLRPLHLEPSLHLDALQVELPPSACEPETQRAIAIAIEVASTIYGVVPSPHSLTVADVRKSGEENARSVDVTLAPSLPKEGSPRELRVTVRPDTCEVLDIFVEP